MPPQPKPTDPTHCHHCGARLFSHRLTLPRAKTGDLGFCNWSCQEASRANAYAPRTPQA